jgi:twinkle protein
MYYEALQSKGIPCRNVAGEQKTICPKCSSERKNKKDPCLSVNVDSGIWNCHNCGWKGGIVLPKKEYTRPTSELKTLSPSIIKWFESRGISNQTLLRYKITESVEYMPQTQAEARCINFNYFYYGTLVNIKYRDNDKNFKLVSGAMLCLYGLNVALDNSDDELVITEGEMDTLSFYEAGVKTAVSVPNGASKGNQKLEWLEESLHLFEGRRCILATDTDEPGIALRNELARRIGKQNCSIITFPPDCKDANDVLLKHGKEALKACYDNAEPFPVDGIDIVTQTDLVNLWEEGYPEGFDTGWSNMDEHFIWHPGMVTLITGEPGSGKTTFLKNLLVALSERHDWSHLIYSAEEANATFAMTDLMSIVSGKSFFNTPNSPRITRQEIEDLTPFMTSHFKYYKLSENDGTVETIIEKAKEMVQRHGIRGLVIDNMSTVERGIKGNDSNRHHAIGNMMRDIRAFAREYGVHVWLVAHPKKLSKLGNGKYEVPTGYDVGDSSHYYNAPDVGVTVYRNRETKQTEIHWWKIRFRFSGQEGIDFFTYDLANSRYYPTQKLNDGSDKTKFKGQPINDYTKFIAAGTQ